MISVARNATMNGCRFKSEGQLVNFDAQINIMPTEKRYEDETTDYRRGFVEGESGERDIYLLYTGCTDKDEYCRGYLDGILEFEKQCKD